jgi:hypothetical protein
VTDKFEPKLRDILGELDGALVAPAGGKPDTPSQPQIPSPNDRQNPNDQ